MGLSILESLNFTQGKIFSPLIRFALPVLAAILLQSLYGAVDLLVVGQFSDPADVSAVATGSQIVATMTFVITDLAVGITVLLGQLIGQGKRDRAGDVIGAGIVLFFILGVVMTAVMELIAQPAAAAMNAPPESFAQTTAYIRICCGGTVFIIAYNVLGSIFRGIGNARIPLLAVLIATVFNIFGDLLLVAGLHMGAAGAAYATVIAQALSVLLSLIIIRRMKLPIRFGRENIRFQGDLIRRIVTIGIPIALQDLLVSISFLVILAIVNAIGVIASAGVGVADRLCAMIMLVPSAFMQAMSAFVAQNYGAGRMDRALRALRYCIVTSLAFGLVLGWLSFFHGDWMSSLFSSNAEVIAASADYLRAYAIDCLFTAFLFCFAGFFNGMGRTKFVMIQGIVGAFGVRVPVSYLMSKSVPVSLFKIGLATPCSTLLQITLCFIYLFILKKKKLLQPQKL